ncbi:zinc finger CCCH domain-containing protein 10-like [Bacillus rossius redtenbacheri]|uniref:zinc finger CCCH domain-containing protein 10-like n=1 Tax=Bacillus rossius redtenbacheri TaxID=93214 RepID=UPI002FDDE99C
MSVSENGSVITNGDCSSSSDEDRVCRDYIRNVCRRGKRCKFLHPDEVTDNGNSKCDYVFCHDFQNSKCTRVNCRFVHCSQDDEEYYKTTGELPSHVLESLIRKGMVPNILFGRPGEAPVCKDYINGECRRGAKCKFRHLSVRDYEREIAFCVRSPPRTNTTAVPITRCREINDFDGTSTDANISELKRRYSGPDESPEMKRRQQSSELQMGQLFRENCHIANGHYFPTPLTPHVLSHAEARALMVEDENMMLRKKVEVLKKQVSDLTATNEFLLDQNAQLRMGSKRTASVTAVTVPAVTITNTGAPTMQVQPITAQIQPAQAPTPQQMVNAAVAAGALRTVTASVATVPVSIAAVAGAPVSIATVSMAPVQIPPPVVTMAQQTLTVEGPPPPPPPGPPPQQGQQQNSQQPPLPMSISGPTASMVSYPIMTQELRPVLQNSLSH